MDLKDIISRLRGERALRDEEIYEFVGREVESGERRTGLWTKALAESGWDEKAAKARYVEYRVAQVKELVASGGIGKEIAEQQPPEKVIEYLGKAIRSDRYRRKYFISEGSLRHAISRGRIRAYQDGSTLWVEDKRI